MKKRQALIQYFLSKNADRPRVIAREETRKEGEGGRGLEHRSWFALSHSGRRRSVGAEADPPRVG